MWISLLSQPMTMVALVVIVIALPILMIAKHLFKFFGAILLTAGFIMLFYNLLYNVAFM